MIAALGQHQPQPQRGPPPCAEENALNSYSNLQQGSDLTQRQEPEQSTRFRDPPLLGEIPKCKATVQIEVQEKNNAYSNYLCPRIPNCQLLMQDPKQQHIYQQR